MRFAAALWRGRSKARFLVKLLPILFFACLFLGIHWLSPTRPYATLTSVDSIDSVMFSPNGKTLITGRKEGPLRVWDLESGTERFAVANDWTGMHSWAVKFSPDSMILAAYQKDGDLILWDTLTGKALASLDEPVPGNNGWGNFCFSPDSEFLAIRDSSIQWPDKQFIKLWNISARKEQGRIEGQFWTMRFAPDSRSLATVAQSSDGRMERVLLWSLDSPHPRLVKEYQVSASHVAFSPDITAFVQFTPADDREKHGELAMVDMNTWTRRCSFTYPEKGARFQELSFAANGRILIAHGCGDNTIIFADALLSDTWCSVAKTTLWDLTSNPKELGSFSEKPAISPDGQWLAVPRDAGVSLLEIATMKERSNLTRPNDILFPSWGKLPFGPSIIFSPDSKRLVVSGLYYFRQGFFMSAWLPKRINPFPGPSRVSVTRLWDVETGQELAEFVDCREVVFSPDGKTLATLSEDRTVKLWEVPPRKPLGRILGWTTGIWLIVMLGAWCARRLVRRSRRHAS